MAEVGTVGARAASDTGFWARVWACWGGTRALARQVGRVVPRAVAAPVAVVLTAAIFIGLLEGVVVDTMLESVNQTCSLVDKSTTPGIEQPTTPLRSGGPESLVPWAHARGEGPRFRRLRSDGR